MKIKDLYSTIITGGLLDIQEAFKTNHFVSINNNKFIMYCEEKTGLYKDLVSCDYFIIIEDNDVMFSTSIDLYPEDIFSNSWEKVSLEKERELLELVKKDRKK